jgi:hypothetical protein
MSFSIKFLDEPIPDEWLVPGDRGELAVITITNFSEKETILTNYWTKDQYIAQWLDAIETITNGSGGKAAFATAVHNTSNPKHGYVVMWWALYKQGGKIIIRNSSIPYEEGMALVDLDRLYDYVPDRDDNQEVSEWEIAIEDLQEFKSYLQKLQQA